MHGITLHTTMTKRKAMGKGLFLANNTYIRKMSKSKVFYGKIDSFEEIIHTLQATKIYISISIYLVLSSI